MNDLARVFKALSDPTRLTIMGLVFRHGPLCVCEVERILGITQSKASRHLRYLRNAGVLEDRRDGAVVNYSLPAEPEADVERVLTLLRGLLEARALPNAARALVQIRAERTLENR